MRIEGVHPGKQQARISFALPVTQPNACVSVRIGILEIVWKRIIWNLKIVPPQRRHQSQLIGWVHIKNERSEPANAVDRIVRNLRNRGLQAQIATIRVHAEVVSKPLRVAAET